MKCRTTFLAVCLLTTLATTGSAQNKRDQAVKGDRRKFLGNPAWVYDDLAKATAAAKAAKKPMLIVFR